MTVSNPNLFLSIMNAGCCKILLHPEWGSVSSLPVNCDGDFMKTVNLHHEGRLSSVDRHRRSSTNSKGDFVYFCIIRPVVFNSALSIEFVERDKLLLYFVNIVLEINVKKK